MLPASNLPLRTNNFVGRKSFLKKIDSAFNIEKKKIVALHSFSGTGKTSIANEYGYSFKSKGFVYWIKSDNGELNFIADDLGIQLTNVEKNDKSIITEKIKSELEKISRNSVYKFSFLFIFDNFDEYDNENDIDCIIQLADLKNIHILITTTTDEYILKTNLSSEYSEFIPLELFDDLESIEFTKNNLKDITNNESEIDDLIEFFEIKSQKRRPITLTKMIIFVKLKLEKDKNLTALIKKLKLTGKKKLEQIIIDDELFELIKLKNEKSLKLLNYASFLDSDFMFIKIFTEMLEFEEDELENSVNDLKKLSLINIERKNEDMGLKMHKTLQNETKEYLRNKNFQEISNEYYIRLNLIFMTSFFDELNKWRKQKYYSNFKLIVGNIVNEDEKKYLMFATFLNGLNMYYDEALKCLLQALEIVKKKEDNFDDLRGILNNIGNIYSLIGKYDEAQNYFNQSTEISKRKYGTNHPNILINIGENYRKTCKYDEALKCYNESLEIFKKTYGTNANEGKAKALNNIGLVYMEKNDFENALDNFLESLETKRKFYGTEINSSIALTLNNIGIIFTRLNMFEEALIYYNKSLEINRKIFETDANPAIALTLNNIGLIQKFMGKNEEAVKYDNESLEINRKIYGNDVHPDIEMNLNNIGIYYKNIGNNEEALKYFIQSLETLRKIYGNDFHQSIADVLNNIGTIYRHMGKYDEALEYLNKALEINRIIYGNDNHSGIADALKNIGNVYTDLEKYNKALKYYNESLNISRKIYGNDSQQSIVDVLNNIDFIYKIFERKEKALKYFNESLKIEDYDDDPSIAMELNNTGIYYKNIGNNQEALEYFNQVLEIHRNIYGNDYNLNIADALSNIGIIYRNMGKYDEALEYLNKALEINGKIYGNEYNSSIADALKSIADICLNTGKYDKAIKYYNESLKYIIKCLEIRSIAMELNKRQSGSSRIFYAIVRNIKKHEWK